MNEIFTIEELITALTAAAEVPPPGGAFTVEQICEESGHSKTYVYRELRKLIHNGVMECVRIPMTRIDGARTNVPGYRLVTHE